ncbi:hypothetical protein ACFL4A_01135 [bacterium]
MKKIICLIMILSLASIVCAEKFTMKPYAGYTSVSLSNLYSVLGEEKDIIEKDKFDTYDDVTASLKKAKGASIVGIDFDYAITEKILIGPRVAYIDVSKIELKTKRNADNLIKDWIGTYESSKNETITQKFDLSLLPITVGAKYVNDNSEKFRFNVGLDLGVGLAKLDMETMREEEYTSHSSFFGDYYRKSLEINNQRTYVGSCFVTNLAVGGEYKLNDTFSLGANIGYRFAKVNKMKLDKDYCDYYENDDGDEYEYLEKKGDTKKDIDDNDIEFDFSGVTLTCGLNMAF